VTSLTLVKNYYFNYNICYIKAWRIAAHIFLRNMSGRGLPALKNLYDLLPKTSKNYSYWCFDADHLNNNSKVTGWRSSGEPGVYESEHVRGRFALLGFGKVSYSSGKRPTWKHFRVSPVFVTGSGYTEGFNVYIGENIYNSTGETEVPSPSLRARNMQHVQHFLESTFTEIDDSSFDDGDLEMDTYGYGHNQGRWGASQRT